MLLPVCPCVGDRLIRFKIRDMCLLHYMYNTAGHDFCTVTVMETRMNRKTGMGIGGTEEKADLRESPWEQGPFTVYMPVRCFFTWRVLFQTKKKSAHIDYFFLSPRRDGHSLFV